MRVKRFAAASLLTFLLSVAAQDYVVTVTSVAVWVKATDKSGRPAVGLTSKDFSVSEDNREMPISCFEHVDKNPLPAVQQDAETEESSDQQSPEGLENKRKLILVIDELNTLGFEYRAIKEDLGGFVEKLDPSVWTVMLVSIATLEPVPLVSFTSDYEKILNELESITANAKRDQEIENRKREISDTISSDPNPARALARAEELAAFYEREERLRADMTLKAIGGLAKYVTDAEEHVVILLVSGGINFAPGHQYFEIVDRAVARMNREEFDKERSDFRKTTLDNSVKRHIGFLNRKNVTVYCMNTRGLAGDDPADLRFYQDGMDEIAAQTGGISFKNSNEFQKHFDTIFEDASSYYILCYKPDREGDEGKYHKIQVKVSKPGVHLRYRKGYWG
jgi:VWFA-related protein